MMSQQLLAGPHKIIIFGSPQASSASSRHNISAAATAGRSSAGVAAALSQCRLQGPQRAPQRRRVVLAAGGGGGGGRGPGGFFKKLFSGELGVSDGGGGGMGAAFTGSESKECAMLRANVLGDTVLEERQLLLVYDASRDGWNAGAFHAKCDNQGPAFLIAKTKSGAYFGAFNPLGWASREDYRDAFNAFLVKWPKAGSTEEEPFILDKEGGPGAAIFDFGAEGPIFGADALKIPLGRAQSMGSSYAGTMGTSASSGPEVKTAKSRLGSAYAAPPDGSYSLFGRGEKNEATLTELRVYCGKGLDGSYA